MQFYFLTSEAQRNFRNELFRAIEAQRNSAMLQNKKINAQRNFRHTCQHLKTPNREISYHQIQ